KQGERIRCRVLKASHHLTDVVESLWKNDVSADCAKIDELVGLPQNSAGLLQATDRVGNAIVGSPKNPAARIDCHCRTAVWAGKSAEVRQCSIIPSKRMHQQTGSVGSRRERVVQARGVRDRRIRPARDGSSIVEHDQPRTGWGCIAARTAKR